MTKPRIIIALETVSSSGVSLITVECNDTVEAGEIIDNFEAGPSSPSIASRHAWILYDPAERPLGAWG